MRAYTDYQEEVLKFLGMEQWLTWPQLFLICRVVSSKTVDVFLGDKEQPQTPLMERGEYSILKLAGPPVLPKWGSKSASVTRPLKIQTLREGGGLPPFPLENSCNPNRPCTAYHLIFFVPPHTSYSRILLLSSGFVFSHWTLRNSAKHPT